MVVSQGFQFFRQNAWFLKNNRALSNFLCGILHYLINITNLSKKKKKKKKKKPSPYKPILY